MCNEILSGIGFGALAIGLAYFIMKAICWIDDVEQLRKSADLRRKEYWDQLSTNHQLGAGLQRLEEKYTTSIEKLVSEQTRLYGDYKVLKERLDTLTDKKHRRKSNDYL